MSPASRCTAWIAMNAGPVAPSRSSRASGVSCVAAMASSTSALVSATCVWIGRSSWLANITIVLHVASDTVYGACGASENDNRAACLNMSRAARPRAMYASASAAYGVGKSRIGTRSRVRIEIHVVATGDAAAQHFRGAEQRAVMDEVRCDKPRLARPDLLLEPGLQRHVVGHAPQDREE